MQAFLSEPPCPDEAAREEGYGVLIAMSNRNPAEEIEAAVRCTGKTGAEMEALTAVSVAALTVYDMCKAVDRAMRIGDVRLVHKSGGQSGEWHESVP